MILVEKVEDEGVDEPIILPEQLQTTVDLSPDTDHVITVTEDHCIATIGGGIEPKQYLFSLFL